MCRPDPKAAAIGSRKLRLAEILAVDTPKAIF
jgi:hypothetical protein